MSIWCIGRNYLKHIEELGNEIPNDPIVFLKPISSIVNSGSLIVAPAFSNELHHEVELAVRLDENLELESYVAAVDLTLRDVQSKSKEKGQPWTLAKAFKQSCPMGKPVNIKPDFNFSNLELSLSVNGKERQKSTTANMIHSVPSLLRYLIEHYPMAAGDWILTGTPEGVSKLEPGDKVNFQVGDSFGHFELETNS
ncbi:MAG: fumarylacetoacetate hydrolase family protein [Bdellovibrionales bacterium]